MQVIRLNRVAAFVVGALSVSTVGAQNIVFTNSTNSSASPTGPYSIQLKGGLPVTVAPNGDIRAQCELVDGTGRCVGIPTGTTGAPPPVAGAPTVSISTSAQDADTTRAGLQVAAGTAFSINVSPSGQPVACVRTSNPLLSAWSGAVEPAFASGDISIGTASATPYEFNVKCYNDAGVGIAQPISIESVAGAAPPPPPPPPAGNCSGTNSGSDPQQHYFPPTNLAQAGATVTFTQLWAASGLQVGQQFARLEMGGSQYRSFSFNRDMLNSDGMFFEMKADTSNTGGPRPADSRYAVITECANDLRPGNNASTVQTERTNCRGFPAEGTFLYLNFGAPIDNPRVCNLDPNKTYHMNVTFEDPNDGYQTGKSCNSGFPGSNCAFRIGIFQ